MRFIRTKKFKWSKCSTNKECHQLKAPRDELCVGVSAKLFRSRFSSGICTKALSVWIVGRNFQCTQILSRIYHSFSRPCVCLKRVLLFFSGLQSNKSVFGTFNLDFTTHTCFPPPNVLSIYFSLWIFLFFSCFPLFPCFSSRKRTFSVPAEKFSAYLFNPVQENLIVNKIREDNYRCLYTVFVGENTRKMRRLDEWRKSSETWNNLIKRRQAQKSGFSMVWYDAHFRPVSDPFECDLFS